MNSNNNTNSSSSNSSNSSNNTNNSGFQDLYDSYFVTPSNLAINYITECNNDECPLTMEPIIAYDTTTKMDKNDIFIDSKQKSVKIPEGVDVNGNIRFQCYDKEAFVNYIKGKIINNISKISIKILSADGVLVNLHSIDFAFILQVTTIYDNMIPYKNKEVVVI